MSGYENIKRYLSERARMKGLHPQDIHGMHAGHEREANLTVADLESVCAERDRYRETLKELAAEDTQDEYPPCDLTLDQHIRAARDVLKGEKK